MIEFKYIYPKNMTNTSETYIDKIVSKVAAECHIKNKELTRYYALLILTKQTNITLKDVHDAWAMSMNFRPVTSYCYGHDHKSIVPFDQLSKETQEKDANFVKRLNHIAKELQEMNI